MSILKSVVIVPKQTSKTYLIIRQITMLFVHLPRIFFRGFLRTTYHLTPLQSESSNHPIDVFWNWKKKRKKRKESIVSPETTVQHNQQATKNFIFTLPLFFWVNIKMINVMFNLILVVDVKRSKIMSFEFFHFMPEKKKENVIS